MTDVLADLESHMPADEYHADPTGVWVEVPLEVLRRVSDEIEDLRAALRPPTKETQADGRDDVRLTAHVAAYALLRLCRRMGWIAPEEILDVVRKGDDTWKVEGDA